MKKQSRQICDVGCSTELPPELDTHTSYERHSWYNWEHLNMVHILDDIMELQLISLGLIMVT